MSAASLDDLLGHVRAVAAPGDPDAVIAAVDDFAMKHNDAMMHLGAEKGEMLDRVVTEAEPGRVLELGSFFGYSAIRMARLMVWPPRELISLEHDRDHARISREMIAHAGLQDIVSVVEGQAADIIDTLDGTFDLVLVDHYAGNYRRDLVGIESRGLLHEGSVVVADNVIAHADRLDGYLDHVRGGGRYRSTLHRAQSAHRGGAEDGMEVSVWLGPT
ncbi:MAG: O-methyltransferase [Hyphomicrobiales bacterium]